MEKDLKNRILVISADEFCQEVAKTMASNEAIRSNVLLTLICTKFGAALTTHLFGDPEEEEK